MMVRFNVVRTGSNDPVYPTLNGSVVEIRSPIFKRLSDNYPTVISTGLSVDLPVGCVGLLTEARNDDEDCFPLNVHTTIYNGGEIVVKVNPRLRYDEYVDINKGDIIANMILLRVENLNP